MQFKDECKPGFSYQTRKTVSGVKKKWRHRSDLFSTDTSA